MMYYTAIVNDFGVEKTRIIRIDDDGSIWWLGLDSLDEQYLAWLSEGNEPKLWEPEQ